MQGGKLENEARGGWVLDLSRRGLRALPPDALRAAGGAVAVHVEGNELTAASCACIDAFADARRIHLDENDLGSLPAALARLRHLEVLTAARSRLMAIGPALPAPLPVLRTLSLAENRIAGRAVAPATWSSLPALEELTLAGNALTAVPGLTRCRRLRVLCLDRNRLQALPDDVGALRRLEHLRVDCNQLTAIPASLAGCARLVVLGASRNALHSLHGVDFARLPQIRALHLSGNALREVPVSLRAAAGSLRVLGLSHNALARLPHWLATRVAREADMPLLGAFAAHGNPCATPDDSEGTASRGPAPARSQAGPGPVVAPSGAGAGAGAGGRGEGSRAGEGERTDETRFAARTCGGEVPTDLDATLATLSRIQRGLEALGGAGRI